MTPRNPLCSACEAALKCVEGCWICATPGCPRSGKTQPIWPKWGNGDQETAERQ